MTDRDELGSYRPTREDAPTTARGPNRDQRRDAARPEPGFALPPIEPVPVPPRSSRAAAPRPAPPPPRVAPIDIAELAEQLPRVARTGPARPPDWAAAVRSSPLRSQPAGSAPPARRQSHRSLDDDAIEAYEEDAPRGLPRPLKVLGVLTIIGATMAVFGAVALMVYAPVDLVRDRLVAEVKARTGRNLVIGGKAQISFWPNVAVSVTDVALSNPPGMSGAPLVAMARLDATIQLWPLLSKQVLVDRIVLQGPRFTLVTDAQGRRNWDFADAQLFDPNPYAPRRVQYAKAGPLALEDLPEELRDFAKGATDANRAARAANPQGFALARIRIVDGHLVHTDARTNSGDTFTSIDMTIDAGEAKGPLQATLQAAGTFEWRGETMRLDTRIMPMQALADGTPAQATIALTSDVGQITFTGTATGGAAPKLDGTVTAKTPSLARASAVWGQPISGDLANGPLTFKGKVSASSTRTSMTDTTLLAPGLNLTGALTLDQSGPRPKLTGTLRAADVNLDALQRVRLLSPPARPQLALPRVGGPIAPRVGPSGAPKSIEDILQTDTDVKPQVRGFLSRDGWNEGPLDLANLGILDVDVRLTFARLVSQSLNTNQGQVHAVVTGRAAKLTVEDLALHEGKARGTVSLDATHAKPVFTLAMVMDGVALGPLLKDAGADGLDGRAKLNITVTGMGQSERQIVDSLSGKAEITIPRGTFTGYDVGAIARGLAQMKLPRAERDPNAKTEFTDLGVSFTIAKGIADTRDFRVVTREARAIGAGQIALGGRTIDMVVRPKLTAPAEAGGQGVNLSALDLPVRISGPLMQPNVTADLQALMANPAKALEAVDPATRREVEDTVKGVLAGDAAATAKARDVLNKLFGR